MSTQIEVGFSKNGVRLRSGTWYFAKRDKDNDFDAWYCQNAFRSDDRPKLLRHPWSLTWDDENKNFIRNSPSPYDFDYDFYVERELSELEVAAIYGINV